VDDQQAEEQAAEPDSTRWRFAIPPVCARPGGSPGFVKPSMDFDVTWRRSRSYTAASTMEPDGGIAASAKDIMLAWTPGSGPMDRCKGHERCQGEGGDESATSDGAVPEERGSNKGHHHAGTLRAL